MKYLIITNRELARYNLLNYEAKFMEEDDIDSVSRVELPWSTPTGILPPATRSYCIPESNKYYTLLTYTGVGWIHED